MPGSYNRSLHSPRGYQRNYYQSVYNQAASEEQEKKSRHTDIFGTILSVAASLLPLLL